MLPIVMMRPDFRSIISGATSRQQRMALVRLRLSTLCKSASEMLRQSSCSGRPPRPTPVPAAPMSPPAQHTNRSIRPQRWRTSPATRRTSASSHISPQTGIVSPSCLRAISSATCCIDSPSPNVLGLSGRVPCTATFAPNRQSSSAIARPNPRDEPVIQAACPAKMRSVIARVSFSIEAVFVIRPQCVGSAAVVHRSIAPRRLRQRTGGSSYHSDLSAIRGATPPSEPQGTGSERRAVL